MNAPRPPRPVRALVRALFPVAERDEVLVDLEREFQRRASTDGVRAARRWVWRQGIGSIPPLLKRGWWRGMTGFEPRANRMRPGGPMFESWIMDARYAVRRLISRPVYAALAILTLALGAGGTAAIFSVVRTLLLEPLPIAREGEVGVLWFDGSWSQAEFAFLRPDFPGFQRMAAYRPDDTTIEMPGGQLRLATGIASTAELFDVLGTAPMLGRGFQQGDDAPGAESSTIISYSLWQELGADRGIIGRPIRLGGIPRTVIGVMPAGFWFPSPETKVWNVTALNPQSGSGQYTLVGRVADGLELTQLDGQLQSIAARVGEQFPAPDQWDKRTNPEVLPAREFLIGDVRPSLLATLAAMAVILLIACANVAALMLGQVDARANEMAVRSALGANRQRLVQQLLFESIVIGVGAGIMGALLALAGFQVLVGSLPLGELAATATLDWTVFWAAMLAALVAAVLIAIVPGAALWRGSSLQSTMATTRTGGIAGRGGRLEGGLVIAQMALAVLLAAGAGLLIRSVANLRAIDPGVATDGVLLVETAMPTRLQPDERRRAILDVLPALASLPGVTSVGAAQRVPLSGSSGDNWGIRVVGKPDLPQSTTAFRMVTRDYLRTLGMPLVAGRSFDISDREGSERVVVINQALADKYFPGEDPLGRRLQTFDAEGERIIGVVATAAEAVLTDAPVPARYMLYEHVPPVWHQVTFVLRTGSDSLAGSLLESARGVIEGRSSQLAVQSTTTMGARFDRAIGPAGQVVTLLTLLAGLALVLGAVGVYGVISHYVTRRRRDYGVRLALGQPPAAIVRQVVARGASLVLAGAALGVVAALFLTRIIATLLYGVESTDPLALIAAVLLLLAVGVVAAFVPARRASLTDPALVLRQ
jgi:putative ABC transport system permease protein